MNGIYLYFVNKHRSSWPVLRLYAYRLSLFIFLPVSFYQLFLTRRKEIASFKLEALADDNFSVAQMVQFLFDREVNVEEKEKILITCEHFSFSYNVFKILFHKGRLKSAMCGKGYIFRTPCRYRYYRTFSRALLSFFP